MELSFSVDYVTFNRTIIGGNCSVLKPSEISPNVSKVISEIINENFNNNYIAVIEGDLNVNQYLLKEKFDYIFLQEVQG